MKELYRLLRYARPYSHALIASVLCMAVVGAAHGLLVTLVKAVFDRVLQPDSPNADVELLTIPLLHWTIWLHHITPNFIHNVWTKVAFGILLCFGAKGICDYLGNYLINWVGLNAITDLRQEVFDHVLQQDAHFFENQTTGRIMSSVMSDIDKIQIAVSTMLADWLRQSFIAIGLLIAMISIDWRLSLISLTVLPFVLIPTLKLGKRIRRTTRSAQDSAADVNQILQETITGHQVVKSFGAEGFESNRFRAASRKLRVSNLKYVAQQAIASPIIEFFGAVTIVGLLTYAREMAKSGTMTAGSFSGFVLALLSLYEPVKRLTGIHNIFQQGLGASQKVFEYLDRQQGVIDTVNPAKFTKFERSIYFDHVEFSYPSAPQKKVLHEVTLEVRRGEIVALVGPSGAGKTTLANLVPRFYDVTAGAVRIDGKDIRDVKLQALRDKISIVAQDTFLFNDTIANNIAYGSPDAEEKDVLEAAKNAMAHEFIQMLPHGYDTVIGERGLKLSGGQRQRISIARALLKNAPILILDEATSHLDTESERLVQQALANLMAHRTVIVIAHRLSTIRNADKIVVLESGSITEAGTHEQLISKGGIYSRLHELQHLEPNAIIS